MYLDEKGLIVQENGDGGDTLQRTGFWWEGISLSHQSFFNYNPIPKMANPVPACEILSKSFIPKSWVRYWKEPYNDPKDTSRDQLVSIIRMAGYRDYRTILQCLIDGVILNWSRYPNGDIAFLQDYGRFIRSFKAWWLWPFLWISDIFILINSFIRIYQGRDFNNVGDDVNHIGDLAQAQKILPTPISFIARKIYKWFRPCFVDDPSGVARTKGLGAAWALSWYFRSASGANTEFIALWTPLVQKF